MRAAWIVVVIACRHDEPQPPPAPPAPVVVAPPTIDATTDAMIDADLRHRLAPAEGAITIAPLTGTLEHELAAAVTIAPGAGYQINTDLQPHLELAPPAAVTASTVRLAHWDRDRLALAFDLTAHERGAYELHGTLHFAVCQRDVCFPKDEPITVALDVR